MGGAYTAQAPGGISTTHAAWKAKGPWAMIMHSRLRTCGLLNTGTKYIHHTYGPAFCATHEVRYALTLDMSWSS